MRIGNLKLSMLALLCCGCSMAFAQQKSYDDVSVAVGLRLWSNVWQGNNVVPVNGVPVVTRFDSDTKTGVIPFALVRYRNFGVSASTLLKTNYTNSDGLFTGTEGRKEYDVNGLYYFLPSASVSLGYKNVQWSNIKIDGPTVALSGTAPLADKFGVYGTLGYGRLSTKIQGSGSHGTQYSLVESGFSYALTPAGAKITTALTLGYRYQRIKASSIPVGTSTTRDFTDNTSGPVFGVVVGF